MLAITLIAAIILLVLDINNVVHLSHWVIAGIGFSPILVSIAILAFGAVVAVIVAFFGLIAAGVRALFRK